MRTFMLAETGLLRAEEADQLTEIGIPIVQLLAKHYHADTDHVRQMIAHGDVKAADVTAAMSRGW